VKPGKTSTAEPEESCFEYVTNIEPTADNIIELSASGRLRWKIENDGFNTQKCGEYELETIRNIRENLIAYMLMVSPNESCLIPPHPS
jgi:hypothetical protein